MYWSSVPDPWRLPGSRKRLEEEMDSEVASAVEPEAEEPRQEERPQQENWPVGREIRGAPPLHELCHTGARCSQPPTLKLPKPKGMGNNGTTERRVGLSLSAGGSRTRCRRGSTCSRTARVGTVLWAGAEGNW